MKSSIVSLFVAAGLLAAGAAHAADESALATAKGCLACHAVDKMVVGPAYKEVAAKYKGDASAAAKLAGEIVKGTGPAGVGWQKAGKAGMPFMPANAGVSEAEAKKLAAWVLSAK